MSIELVIDNLVIVNHVTAPLKHSVYGTKEISLQELLSLLEFTIFCFASVSYYEKISRSNLFLLSFGNQT